MDEYAKQEISLQFDYHRIYFLSCMYNYSQVIYFPFPMDDIVPSVQKLGFFDVADISQNPRILEIKILSIVSYCHDIMAVLPWIFIVSSLISPSLDLYNDWCFVI